MIILIATKITKLAIGNDFLLIYEIVIFNVPA